MQINLLQSKTINQPQTEEVIHQTPGLTWRAGASMRGPFWVSPSIPIHIFRQPGMASKSGIHLSHSPRAQLQVHATMGIFFKCVLGGPQLGSSSVFNSILFTHWTISLTQQQRSMKFKVTAPFEANILSALPPHTLREGFSSVPLLRVMSHYSLILSEPWISFLT